MVVGDRKSMRAGRIQPPFEDVAVDDYSSRQVTVSQPLIHRADVDDKAASGLDGREVGRLDPVQPATTFLEQAIDS